jgi:hypothetical protein
MRSQRRPLSFVLRVTRGPTGWTLELVELRSGNTHRFASWAAFRRFLRRRQCDGLH